MCFREDKCRQEDILCRANDSNDKTVCGIRSRGCPPQKIHDACMPWGNGRKIGQFRGP